MERNVWYPRSENGRRVIQWDIHCQPAMSSIISCTANFTLFNRIYSFNTTEDEYNYIPGSHFAVELAISTAQMSFYPPREAQFHLNPCLVQIWISRNVTSSFVGPCIRFASQKMCSQQFNREPLTVTVVFGDPSALPPPSLPPHFKCSTRQTHKLNARIGLV